VIDKRLITDTRVVIEALRNLHAKGALDYATYSDEWVIKYWHLEHTRHILGYYSFDINRHAAAEIASDKVATYLLLAEAGLPAVRHYIINSPPTYDPDLKLLAKLLTDYGVLVIKPTQGGSGRDVAKYETIETLTAAIAGERVPSWCASPFLEITSELRLVVHDGTIKFAYRKHNPIMVDGLKMFNIKLGTTATYIDPSTLNSDLAQMAIQATHAIGLSMGAVDIVIGDTFSPMILEINSRFSIDYFAGLSSENRQKAVAFYESIVANSLT
jgi:glutathione synthase/RimK-type ligase-like ATP-grasp enzyme